MGEREKGRKPSHCQPLVVLMLRGLYTFLVKRCGTFDETMNEARTKIAELLSVSFGPNPALAFRYLVFTRDVMSFWRLDGHLAPSHTLREVL